MRGFVLVMFAFLTLSACTAAPTDGEHPYQDKLDDKSLHLPQSDALQSCSSYGCGLRDRL
jgi:hypothetical protein